MSFHQYKGVVAAVYHLAKGDTVAGRHQHKLPHTVAVSCGEAAIRVWDTSGQNIIFSQIFTAVDADATLPPDQDHEIEALMDGTVVVTMIEGSFVQHPYVPPVQSGVILVSDLE